MPARRGHEVSLITTTHRRPRMLALANWTTIDGVNYARSEPPCLVRVGDVLWLAAGFVGMTAWLGDAGMVLFVPVAAVVLAVASAVRWAARQRLGWRVDRTIDLAAWQTTKGPAELHCNAGRPAIVGGCTKIMSSQEARVQECLKYSI
jgi:hypothetical protein